MPAEFTPTWQRKAAVATAVGVLLLALIYRFLPGWLLLSPADLPQAAGGRSGGPGPSGLMVSSATPANAGTSIYSEGPPLSLAPFARHRVAPPAPGGPPQVQQLLRRAWAAEAEDRWAGSPDSAAALYQRALALDPGNADARRGLASLDHRLAASASAAIESGDSHMAQVLINLLRTQPGGLETSAPLQARLFVLRHVQPLLTAAAESGREGHGLGPGGASALELYRKALAIDPGNAVATRGIQRLQRAVLRQMDAALAADDFARAARLLAQAASVDPAGGALVAARVRLEQARTRRAANLARRATAALVAGAAPLAQQLAAQARRLDASVPQLARYETQLRDRRLYAGYRPGQLFADHFLDRPGSAPTMTVIPAGSFIMGARPGQGGYRSDQAPAHRVVFARGFALSRSEITVAQFRAFVRATGYVTTAEQHGGAMVYDDLTGRLRADPRADWRDGYNGQPAAGDMPVINVSWADAEAYCDWLSRMTGKDYTLPSEAEYEYAERGGTSGPYWWGRGSPQQHVENLAGALDRGPNGRHWDNAFAGYGDGYWGPAPVMSFLPNPYGLFDIDGNVSEWTADCWHDNYIRAPADGAAWINPGCRSRVVRGASWASTPQQALSAWRMDTPADLAGARIGFRVARNL